jgi:uncharacterized membrane protein YkvI
VKKSVSAFQIASAYVGTVIGAGFASGQEVLRFFCAHGLWGVFGIMISTALFFLIGYAILTIGHRIKAQSHVQVVRFTNGRLLGAFIDVLITIFLFGGLSAMIAGAGAAFDEQLSVHPMWGAFMLALLALLTVIAGTRGVIRANSWLVPGLIAAMLAVCIASLIRNPVSPQDIDAMIELEGATPHWLLSAVNYASYNIVVCIGVLAPMGAAAADRKALLRGALMGAAALGAALLAIYLCVLTHITENGAKQLPMAAAAAGISGVVGAVFVAVLLAAVYTTAVGNLFALSQRMTLALPKKLFIVLAACLALLAGQFGFSNLVRFLYPAVGYGGMAFFAGVAWVWIARRRRLVGPP